MKFTTVLKYAPWVLVALAMGAVAFWQYRAATNARELLFAKNEKLMQADLELGRAKTEMVEQDKLHKIALKDIDKKWKDEIKKREALVMAYGKLKAKYDAKGGGTTRIIYRDGKDKIIDLPIGKLYRRKADGSYEEISKLLWSYKDFRLTAKGDALEATMKYSLHQRFHGTMLETLLPTGGRNHYFKLYEVDEVGNTVGEVKLESFKVLRGEELPEKMFWWNPKLDLGAGFGVTHKADFGWMAELGMSVSAYGKTHDDLRWRFFRLGTGITGGAGGFSLTFSPAMYNLGKTLPFVSNIWLYPFAGFDFNDQVGHFGLGINVVL